MSEPAMLADHIDEQIDTILAVWRSTVEREGDVPEAERLSYGEFLDHVPALLDRLADRLRGRPADATSEGKEHGSHRWRQGYDIGEIVTEFAHLRTALCRSTLNYARDHDWDLDRLEAAYEAIDEVLSEATAVSVRQFQEDSRGEARAAVDEIQSRQRAVEEVSALARSEQAKLGTILRSLPAAVWVVDAEGTIVGANEVADLFHSAIDPSFIGRANIHNLGPAYRFRRPGSDDDSSDDLPLLRALRGETVNQEELVWMRNGEPRTLLVNAAPLMSPEGVVEGAVAVAQDITARIVLEAELKEQRARAEAASQHKTRMVSALSHDVRTPLNAVVLAAQLLEIHFDGSADSEVQECLRTIRHSVRNVLDLLGDLLNLSKLDAGAVPPELSRFPLEPVFDECVSSIENQARIKGLTIHVESDGLAGTHLETDRAKLKQVIGNFLSNAVRYTEQGQIRLFGELTDGQVRISVADTGIGIPPGDQARIFDEFAVLENSRHPKGEGTGLGLAICRRLATLLGGEIELVSAPGQGSTFTLVMPGSTLAQELPGPALDTPHARHTTEVGAILVAEDHPDSRKTLSRVLKRLGYRVVEAGNGREALDLIQKERPLAVLMDVNMPVMNGVDAILALRADPNYRDLPIFALTGDVTPDNQHRIGEAGVNGYLEKPVTWELLEQALGTLGRRATD